MAQVLRSAIMFMACVNVVLIGVTLHTFWIKRRGKFDRGMLVGTGGFLFIAIGRIGDSFVRFHESMNSWIWFSLVGYTITAFGLYYVSLYAKALNGHRHNNP